MEEDNLYCFEQLCENCSNLVILELIELRAWKEKARPFLRYVMIDYQHGYSKVLERLSDDKKEFYRKQNEEAIKTLTELLGGNDERNN